MATIAKVLCILVLLFVSAFAAKIASNEPTNNNRPDEVDESEDDSSEISVDELKTTEHAAANQPHEVDHEKSEDDSFDFSVDDLKITERAAKGPRHHKAGRSKNKRGGKHKNKKGGRRKRGGRKKKVRGKPAEPWKSAEAVPRAEQWKPAEAVQPAKPEEPWKPTEAVQPVQPAEPWKPTEPVQPVKPEEPWKPAEPVQAAVPGAFIGKWELVSNNSGVSAMHAQLFPKTNQVLMYDATLWKVSHIQLPKEKGCRLVDPANNEWDCWSHAVLYETETANLKPLKVVTDTWCSSGGLTVDGGLAGTGGYKTGAKVVRYLDPCETCDWREYPNALADERWYGTQVTLGDGSFIVVGGRAAYSWEYIPREGMNNAAAFTFPFLRDTTDYMYGKGEGGKDFLLENNLYPFVYLVPDGNVYIFANNRSVLLNPNSNRIEREYPVLEGGKRTYPGTASSVLLPLKLSAANPDAVDAEVLICGGAVYDAYFIGNVIRKDFPPALQDCARMVITSSAPIWKREMMPTRRVMGDAVNLPTGDVLFINGAKVGSAGWHCNDDPNRVPLLYKPNAPEGQRFTELLPATIDRMYHSVAVLLPDGRILIGGSNDNDGYHYNVKFPTELRVEKFSPPYLDPAMAWRRPEILVETSDKFCPYGRWFSLNVRSAEYLDKDDQLQVTMYAPPFVTHSISMNQRLLVLDVFEVKNEVTPGVYKIVAVAPPSGNVAPPGYYLLTVVHNGIPSPSIWFQVK